LKNDNAIAFSLDIETEHRAGGACDQQEAGQAFRVSPHGAIPSFCGLALVSVVKERAKAMPVLNL
jgi:hypothetical protein